MNLGGPTCAAGSAAVPLRVAACPRQVLPVGGEEGSEVGGHLCYGCVRTVHIGSGVPSAAPAWRSSHGVPRLRETQGKGGGRTSMVRALRLGVGGWLGNRLRTGGPRAFYKMLIGSRSCCSVRVGMRLFSCFRMSWPRCFRMDFRATLRDGAYSSRSFWISLSAALPVALALGRPAWRDQRCGAAVQARG